MEKQPVCDCEVIHEDIVNEVRKNMSDMDEYIELASLFKLFGDVSATLLHCLSLQSLRFLISLRLLSLQTLSNFAERVRLSITLWRIPMWKKLSIKVLNIFGNNTYYVVDLFLYPFS